MRKDNRGLSLIELIVAMAIMAIFTGVAIGGLSKLFSKDAESCASKIVSALQSNRTTAMGKNDSCIKIYEDSTSGRIVIQEVVSEYNSSSGSYVDVEYTPIEVGKKDVMVEFKMNDGVTETTASLGNNSNPLTIRFNRGTGALKPDGSGAYCSEISVTAAGRTSVIVLNSLTGRVAIK